MPKTGSHLRIQDFGSNVLGVRLEGNPRRPEPDEFRVAFPGGDISVVRTLHGDYWAHVRVDKEGQGLFVPGQDIEASITDARLDIVGKHSAETNCGDFNHPELYHLAVRVTRKDR